MPDPAYLEPYRQMTPEEARAAADRGAAVLDRFAAGWPREVQAHRLLMDDGCRCLLGQLYGMYSEGLLVLQAAGALVDSSIPESEEDEICATAWERACAHGFYGNSAHEELLLREAWVQILTERNASHA